MRGKKVSIKEMMERLRASSNERRKLCDRLVAHLESGFSVESFGIVSNRLLGQLMKEYPLEFPVEAIETALDKGRHWWESVGRGQANGTCLGNSRTWYYNMSNRYGWRERFDIEAETKGQVNVNVISYSSKAPKSKPEQS